MNLWILFLMFLLTKDVPLKGVLTGPLTKDVPLKGVLTCPLTKGVLTENQEINLTGELPTGL